MEKLKVSPEMAEALDKLEKDDWGKQYNLIAHCKAYSGNGILMRGIYRDELKILDNLKPLEFAKCMIIGYEVDETNNIKGDRIV